MSDGIVISGLSKTYRIPSLFPWKKSRAIKALEEVNLTCPRGQITGLLGPNGAGKTTLLKILAGLVTQDTGTVTCAGQARGGIGLATSNDRSFYWRLTGRQNLDFFAALYGLRGTPRKARVREVLREVGLEEDGDKPFRLYSSGMKQKLIMARALLNNPLILLLDEPTVHIDPLARTAIYTLIQENFIRKRGTTVLLCTHDLMEAQLLSHKLVLLEAGKILAQGELAMIQQQLNKCLLLDLTLTTPPDPGWERACRVADFHQEAEKLVVTLHAREDIPGIVKAVVSAGGGIRDCRIREDSLLDIFTRLGREGGEKK